MAEVVETQPVDAQELQAELRQHGIEHLPPDLMVYEIAGPMFFGAVENFERALLQTHADPKVLVIRLRQVPFIDLTGIQTLEEVIQKLRKRGIEVWLCEANERVLGKLLKSGVVSSLTSDGYAGGLGDALRRALGP
jgi:SulP family sulfate permease